MNSYHIKGRTSAGIALVVVIAAYTAAEALQIAARTLHSVTVIF